MSRSVLTACIVSLAFVAGAVLCGLHSSQLRRDSEWLLARGNAEAQEYTNSLESAHADAQLQTFDARRTILERANRWQRGEVLCGLGAVLSAFSAYLLYLYWRLRQQLVDATDGLDDAHRVAAAVPIIRQ